MKLPKIRNTFSFAPHRMFFFGGVVQPIISLTWWLTWVLIVIFQVELP
jgi:hypothetical protein